MDDLTVIGLDLSLSGTGLSIVSFDENFLVTFPFRLDPYDKDFRGVFSRILLIKRLIRNAIADFDPNIVAVETAIPKGQWAAGSFGLVSVILDFLLTETYAGIYLYHPTYMDFVFAKKGHSKQQSVTLAYEIIETEELKTHLNHRLNHDEAESFIFAYAASIQYGRSPKYLTDRLKVAKAHVFREPL